MRNVSLYCLFNKFYYLISSNNFHLLSDSLVTYQLPNFSMCVTLLEPYF